MKISSIVGIIIAVVVAILYYKISTAKALSVIIVAFQYLSRPFVTFPKDHIFTPITHPSAWNGSYLSTHPELWTTSFTEEEQGILTTLVKAYQFTKKPIYELQKSDFPLPDSIIIKIQHWQYELKHGLGFHLARGVPVHQWTIEQSEIFYYAFGHYLGIPGAQDSLGNPLGHVTDIGPSTQIERPYRTHEDIAYHVDGSDVVTLLCIHPAKQGGSSRIISSTTMYNELLKHTKGQEYIRRLYDYVLLFTRKTFGVAKYMNVRPFRMDQLGILRTYYNQDFFARSYRHPNGSLTEFGEKDPFVLEVVDAADAILHTDLQHNCGMKTNLECMKEKLEKQDLQSNPVVELGLEMYVQPGDMQMVSNHYIQHARTEFVDYTDDEIAAAEILPGNVQRTIGRRNLIRLWVSYSNEDMPWNVYLTKQLDLLNIFGSIIEGLIYYR